MRTPQPQDGSDLARIAALEADVAAQAETIREQAEMLAHSRKIFERASAAARIGVWECRLADEHLTWTDVVYDIFELPRGSALDRGATVLCYPEDSRRAMEEARARAIAERSGFTLDAEIVTAKDAHRWIRITATVECEGDVPVRIFGMKQDITEEKLLSDRTRYLAEYDVMTGLANRASFQTCLGGLDAQSRAALLLVDLDGFKQVNDTMGHAFGDECLREAARRLEAACPEADLVSRIGGDEFAVILKAPARGATTQLAAKIVAAFRKPIVCERHSIQIGASVGIARLGDCLPSDLFVRADLALYAAKAAGRGTYRSFKPEMVTGGSFRAA
ncbi:diguanylate cyclase domain-containing protein [Aurantimonas sp. VKM B-3413]|uniref:diguanylate cyclase domain-containing protein n=1 Tax=Aurantimonas sp. VKM B-3413 TaxID=2779401 RepID=UPI001E57634C|nr:diguanylate cyclase [Aurantimonas sp. VKM B-3413]MCB8836523.1 diguanylate cyclase [Aurantimonas sp. VKM B-3413]